MFFVLFRSEINGYPKLIYPRLSTTIISQPFNSGVHPSLKYSVSTILYQSSRDVDPILPTGPITINQEFQNLHIAAELNDLAGYMRFASPREADEISRRLRGIGVWIAENILQSGHLCACHGNGIPRTVEIIADRQDIPWELTWLVDDFLARKVVHARYPFRSSGRRTPVSYPERPELAIVVGRSRGLFAAEAEIEDLCALYKAATGLNAEVFVGERVDVDLIRGILDRSIGAFDIVHYIGHGDADQDQVWLELIGPPFLQSNVPAVIPRNPLVFWNCCLSGSSSVTRYQSDVVNGFGSRFLSGGAGHFIGPLFPVSDITARKFAVAFYTHLFAGEPVGESLYEAKNVAGKDDPLALTYVLYGNPGVEVVSRA
jgi:hypothetical protein